MSPFNSFCRNCNRKFHIFSNAPLVEVRKSSAPQKNSENTQKAFDKAIKDVEEKFSKQLEDQQKVMDDYVEESNKKLQDQRKINLEIMKKLNVLSKSQEDILKMFHEQTGESKKVIETLTRIITQELVAMKKDIQSLQDEFDSYLYHDHHDECDHHECDHDHEHTEED